ncbi:hypothetical protein HanPI659440_Chr05g0192541 [Helianthus annuus]|nr:hypothetical protein HanPI659440_Chr05g0192541 [Helianthus annuus]
MRARIIRKWNQGYKMHLIFIDEKVDVVGSVIWCGGLEFVGRPSKETNSMKSDIQELELRVCDVLCGMIMLCSLTNSSLK